MKFKRIRKYQTVDKSMKIIKTPSEMKEYSAKMHAMGKKIALVPTMGALHQGHLSLVKQAQFCADICVMSIFVNPTQFGPNEDFAKYPRPIENDIALAEAENVDVLFIPENSEIYFKDASTYVDEELISRNLCGKSRPKHFKGVATVVCILFNIVNPDFAIFGEKDAQQISVIRRMVRDLFMDTKIVAAPIVREKNGLAMSSRNAYLSSVQMIDAVMLHASLLKAKNLVAKGCTNVDRLIAETTNHLSKSSQLRIIYVNAVDAETSLPVSTVELGKTRIVMAVWVGTVRLIDNMVM